jgi:hypothetical protein
MRAPRGTPASLLIARTAPVLATVALAVLRDGSVADAFAQTGYVPCTARTESGRQFKGPFTTDHFEICTPGD